MTIDLGSAYTKVAVRNGWDADASLVDGGNLAPTDQSFCIPSVVAHVKGEWLIGLAAAKQRPDHSTVAIYRDWKRLLFRPREDRGNGHSLGTPGNGTDATEIATTFLRGLRDALARHLPGEVEEMPVRVCTPHFGEFGLSQRTVIPILEAAGWRRAEDRPTLYEPEANALGLLSKGKNATWKPKAVSFQPDYGRSVALQRMIERPLSTMLKGMFGNFGLLVTDIGAYTTDFGYVRFDASLLSDDWNRPQVNQQSVQLGVHELDAEVTGCLSPKAQAAVRAASAFEWDQAKGRLYGGEPAALRDPTGGTVTVGSGLEGKRVKAVLEAFADRVWRARAAFVATLAGSPVQGEAVTGGGSLIPAVRDALLGKLQQARVRWLYDLLDEQSVRESLKDDRGNINQRELQKALSRQRDLTRGGSAIGGCSVFFEEVR